jgi:hypothetical protein
MRETFMRLVKEISGGPIAWGTDGKIAVLLPEGISNADADLLDIRILEESGGYVLDWYGRKTERAGSSMHDSIEGAQDAARHQFDVWPTHWEDATIRRAVHRSFPAEEVRLVMDALFRIRHSDFARAAVLALAYRDQRKLFNLIERYVLDSRDVHLWLHWKTNYESDAVHPTELLRRYQELGLLVPKDLEATAAEFGPSTPP